MILRMAAASGERGDQMVAEQVVIPLERERSLVARAARTREPVVVNDVSQEAGFMSHPLLPETRSELTLPLLVGDRLLGVMGVQADRRNQFGGDDVRIQQTLAAQIAIALQNSNLYAEQLATAAKLREVDRLKSEFLASMSHELRTPLNSIIGFADVMLEGIDGPLNERMTEDVTFIRDSGRHLRELIGEILDMSKIEAGMMELRYNKVDPKRLAKDVMSAASGLRQNKELELRMDVDPDTEIIQADEMRLRQILYNLMSNAVKFTEQGYVALRMKTTADALLVIVEDTGIGIRAEDIPIVFEQFRQVDGSLTRKVGGTGLGMPISKSLVELHGGQMGVDSTPGKGSSFWFTIPKTGPTAAAKGDTGPLRPGTGPLRLGPPR
jgi:signal transduction histidine kinase